MSPIRILGIVLLVAGVILLFFGWQASGSLVEDVHESMTGRFTDETMRYFIGGGVAAVAGLLLTLFGARR
jgi:drug/metabolite transporter (DMT)-like permease